MEMHGSGNFVDLFKNQSINHHNLTPLYRAMFHGSFDNFFRLCQSDGNTKLVPNSLLAIGRGILT